MDTYLSVYPKTEEQLANLKVFCLSMGMEFQEQHHPRKCSEVYMKPTKALATFMGSAYLNRYGQLKPSQALEFITTYAKRENLYHVNIEKEGIVLNDSLRDVFITNNSLMDYNTLVHAIEGLFEHKEFNTMNIK